MGVRDDWYPLWEASDDSLRGFTGIDERKKNGLPTDGSTDGPTDRPMDRPTDRPTDRPKDRPMDGDTLL